jgi:hypothetical protein
MKSATLTPQGSQKSLRRPPLVEKLADRRLNGFAERDPLAPRLATEGGDPTGAERNLDELGFHGSASIVAARRVRDELGIATWKTHQLMRLMRRFYMAPIDFA